MQVNGVNSTPNFGMSFRLKGSGAYSLAHKFHCFSDPKIAEAHFAKDYIKPLEKLKSEIIYDGRSVIIQDPNHASAIEVLDKAPEIKPFKDMFSAHFYTKSIGLENDTGYHVKLYKNKEDIPDFERLSAPEKQLKIAKEIGEELDKFGTKSVESTQDTARRLENLYA